MSDFISNKRQAKLAVNDMTAPSASSSSGSRDVHMTPTRELATAVRGEEGKPIIIEDSPAKGSIDKDIDQIAALLNDVVIDERHRQWRLELDKHFVADASVEQEPAVPSNELRLQLVVRPADAEAPGSEIGGAKEVKRIVLLLMN